jgi:quercetin dioxygenase-like cupin family protein
MTSGSILAGAFGVLAALPIAAQQAPSPPPGITRTVLVDNASVLVARLRFAPGAREEVHTHPFSAVVVYLERAEVDMRLGAERATRRREPGSVESIAAETPHAAANVGRDGFEIVTIAPKPDRTRGREAPASRAPDGITRTPVLENADARVTRVVFGPSAREPVHSHPFDLVVVQLTPGRMEVRLGEDVSAKHYAAGDVIFLPRDVPHAVSSLEKRPVELLSVGIR